MQKKRSHIVVVLKYLFVIVGFVLLFFQLKLELYKIDDFSSIELPDLSFRNFGFMFLFLTSILVNWSLEALKWKYISRQKELTIGFFTAFKHVLISLSAGISTPYRAGEIAARVFLFPKESRLNAGVAAMLNSFMQFAVTIFVGYFFVYHISNRWLELKRMNLFNTSWAILLPFLILFVYLFWLGIRKRLKTQKLSFAYSQLFVLLILSVLRYAVFILQYHFLFAAFGIEIAFFDFLSGMAVVFFVLYLLPVIQLADIGIRGTVAVFIFSQMEVSTFLITIIFFLVWLLAVVLPAVAGFYFIAEQKINTR